MAVEIVGREEELGVLSAFLDRAAAGPAALVLEGEAGIGKSTLWLAGVEAARERGLRVLSSRPAEAERGLAHTGLGDVFDDVLGDVLPALPRPRRHALEVALLVEEAGHGSDPRTLAVAVRSALEVLAANGPVVLAVDDVQWLDPSSASALAFALRRIQRPVLLLLARRLDESIERSELERAIEAERVERLRVGPLSLGAIHGLLRARLGRTFARPTLVRIHETSGGNPFYALELARALDADVDPTQPLPVPETLEELLRTRLDDLPRATREALMLVAALGHPSRTLLEAAGVTHEVLEPALAAHLIELADEMIRFTHPLLASVLYQGLSAGERRRAHGLLAEILDDPVSRARHLALASEGPDAEIAAALEDAAAVASGRGVPIVSAELGELALRLTPARAREDRARRLLAAARAHLTSGDLRRVRALAHELLTTTKDGQAFAEALLLLGDVEAQSGGVEDAIALLREALLQASAHPALLATIHLSLGGLVRITEGVRAAERHARASLELAEGLDDDALRAGALASLALLRFNAGEPDALRLAERAFELAAVSGEPMQRLDAAFAFAHVLVWSVQHERARALLESLHFELRDREELASAGALWYLSLVELQAGRWALAADYIGRAREINLQYTIDGRENARTLLVVARVAVHRGEFELARALAKRGRNVAEHQSAYLAPLEASLALAEFWSGDAAVAAAHFAAAERAAHAAEWGEPNMYWWRADFLEALLELSRLDDAVRLLETWEADAVRVGREWVLAQVERCRGLVAAARGDVDGALSSFEEAVCKHEAVEDPFGRARALLALGVTRRRARQKRAAREAIEAALASFEELGAASWSARARAERARIGGRIRAVGLSPAERRVAELVAEGRTNREVAAKLFLGERTVETHLTHIYAKLGVRSRTELARTLPSKS